MSINWNGVFPAVTTKFTENDEFDFDAFDKNIEAQLEAGASGIIIGGSLGEASVLSDSEKIALLQHTVEVVAKRAYVILNIAEQTTKAALLCAENALKYGADGLMMLPPLRYLADVEETIAYFAAVAKSTELPIMIYNNPYDYKIEVTLDMFEELSQYKNIQAVKESTRDVSNVTRMINRFGDRFAILCGVDTLALESLFMGAHGWVAGLVDAFPRETVSIFRLAKAGRMQEALAIYRWFLPVLELDIHPKLVQYIKLAESVTGLGTETVRLPRMKITGDERDRVLGIINHAVKNRPELPAGTWGVEAEVDVTGVS
ncbi:dihydrodipicolinate synthase family protein [Mucilaginibacter phyllosphaerae]|uniref:4-hydroxy-tetrahydrodipicolinate synthase n=1 Tax=Mucilaginibacter phyllosphaerae TaxID=1812349 RepID=A0A4Y8AFL2_9SPHI|nr:dihydrodipicolinate synthase family protein [Mucilaginibacter phyllosphaerae]MBB3968808.1 4-hydroxy-tetrahydrodipicolinate synthase [Mucilaginibacter phyllosphaerae]TEW67558.1 dihydrodipicolinate synthase family protein [Mucilaginibacter phyllosphaerae]GGH13764.1 dihydrodipicolinate synthase family protein [Mucilaginibacter phyllosphaerae]